MKKRSTNKNREWNSTRRPGAQISQFTDETKSFSGFHIARNRFWPLFIFVTSPSISRIPAISRPTRHSRRGVPAVCSGNLIRTALRGGLYKQTENDCYCLNGMKRMDGMAGMVGTAVNAYIRTAPVTDSRDHISGAKNLRPGSRAPEKLHASSEREFLNPASVM